MSVNWRHVFWQEFAPARKKWCDWWIVVEINLFNGLSKQTKEWSPTTLTKVSSDLINQVCNPRGATLSYKTWNNLDTISLKVFSQKNMTTSSVLRRSTYPSLTFSLTIMGCMTMQGTKLRKIWLQSLFLYSGFDIATSSSFSDSCRYFSPKWILFHFGVITNLSQFLLFNKSYITLALLLTYLSFPVQ